MEKPDKNVLREVDEAARSLARGLLRSSPTGALGSLDPADGSPFTSLTTVATLASGTPVILISELSTHTQALHRDTRCSLLLSAGGAGDPLAHPRITLIAKARFLARESQEASSAARRFLARHQKAQLYAGFADFSFVLLEPVRASLNGGFGKAFELQPSDFLSNPDQLSGFDEIEPSAVEHMNADHEQAIQLVATRLAHQPDGQWAISGIDPFGIDLIDGQQTARVEFDHPLDDASQIESALREMAVRARTNERGNNLGTADQG